MSKELEAFNGICCNTNQSYPDFQKQRKIVETALKALEIIKEKRVNVRCIMSGWVLGKYNSYSSHIRLTQEEFDLLKDVLL